MKKFLITHTAFVLFEDETDASTMLSHGYFEAEVLTEELLEEFVLPSIKKFILTQAPSENTQSRVVREVINVTINNVVALHG